MARKILNLTNPGTNVEFGSDDTDYINKYLTGVDQSATDPVNIATITTFDSEKLCLRTPTTGFKYIFEGQDLEQDVKIRMPLMSDDGEIALSSVTSANVWGDNLQTYHSTFWKIMNPAQTFGYTLVTSNIVANRNITLPLLTADDEIVFANHPITLNNKSWTGLLKNNNVALKQVDTNTLGIRNTTDDAYKDLILNNLKTENYIQVKKLDADPIGDPAADFGWIYLDLAENLVLETDTGAKIVLNGSGGGGGGGSSVIARAASTLDVVATSLETSIFSHSLAGGSLGTDKILRCTIYGDYFNDSGSSDRITVRIKFGATTLYADGIGTISSSSARRPFLAIIYLSANGATNLQKLGGYINMGDNGGADIGLGDLTDDEIQAHTAISGTASEDSTTSKVFDVTVDHDTSHSSISFRRFYALLELL